MNLLISDDLNDRVVFKQRFHVLFQSWSILMVLICFDLLCSKRFMHELNSENRSKALLKMSADSGGLFLFLFFLKFCLLLHFLHYVTKSFFNPGYLSGNFRLKIKQNKTKNKQTKKQAIVLKY